MMNRIKLLMLACAALIISSCGDSPVEQVSKKMSMADIMTNPGFSWFDSERQLYNEDTLTVKKIKTDLNVSNYKFVLFVKPSCSCPGTHKTFPGFYKILADAGVNDNQMEIYSMPSIEANQPYDSMFVISELPAFYVFKNNVPVYSIMDTVYFNQNNGIKYPDNMEEALYEALKK